MTDIVLYNEAKKARDSAYAPYSGYKVGAALLAKSGKIYLGCNVESVSYPCGICAERSVLAQAVAEGERKFIAIAVCGGKDNIENCTPCGMCRQALAEFGVDIKVIFLYEGKLECKGLKELLPFGFE